MTKDGKSIVLIGMPGVGKSTIGVILAKEIGYQFLDAKHSVIATGGSAVYCEEAMLHYKETCQVVYLRCPYEILSKRLGDLKGRGVALKEGQTLLDLYEERSVLYEKYADIIIDEDNKGIEETLELLKEKFC